MDERSTAAAVLPAPATTSEEERWELFGRHTMMDAGGSHWAPWWLMMGWRFMSGGCLLGWATALCAWGQRRLGLACVIAAYFATGTTFALLGFATVLHSVGKEDVRGATRALVAHGAAVCFAVFVVPPYVGEALATLRWNELLRGATPAGAVLVWVPVGAFVVDVILLRARMQLGFIYGVPALLIFSVLLATGFLYTCACATRALVVVGYIVGAVVLLFITIGLTRLQLLCARPPRDSS